MKAIEITHTTDDYVERYGNAIRAAKSAKALVEAISPFKRAADDALACARHLTNEDFKDFTRDLVKARRKMSTKWIETFNERFGDIVMPRKMLIASLTAEHFHAPWGTAFIRCEEIGWPKI
jgi:hypothetical protein